MGRGGAWDLNLGKQQMVFTVAHWILMGRSSEKGAAQEGVAWSLEGPCLLNCGLSREEGGSCGLVGFALLPNYQDPGLNLLPLPLPTPLGQVLLLGSVSPTVK